MDLRALRYFVETVRQNSFTQAASVLCVTQSTVSKMVRQLEEEVGHALLLREGRQVRLTDVGRVVYERGLEALAVVQRLQRDVLDMTELSRGELTVGIPPMVNLFFPSVIQRFRRQYPHVTLMVQEAGGQVIEERVRSGELEVGVTVLPVAPGSGLASAELGSFPICLVGSAQSPWVHVARPGLGVLHEQDVVMPHNDYSLTRHLQRAMEQAGVRPRIVAQSGQWDFLLSMAMAGMGTALLPQPLLERLKLPADAVVRPLHTPDVLWQVGQIWMADRYMSHAARAWLAVCAQEVMVSPAAGT